MDNGAHFLASVVQTLRAQKRLADRAMAQLGDEDFHWTPHPESNSIAIIVKHMAGNMRSRWTDFLTSDGEKPDRDRDGEFIDDLGSSDDVLERWEEGWRFVFEAVEALEASHLQETVTVKGRPSTVTEVMLGHLGHYAQHVGQIVYLAKLRRGDQWETVSIPRTRRAG